MNAYQTYRQTQAQTAAPGELVVMLYQGAIRFVGAGIDGMENNDVPLAHNNLVKAQAIVTELADTLDLENGGDMARNLASIYDYLRRRLVEANLTKNVQPAREVQALLRDLLPAWQAAARQSASTPARPLVSASS
jgi:flagellar protein FliS